MAVPVWLLSAAFSTLPVLPHTQFSFRLGVGTSLRRQRAVQRRSSPVQEYGTVLHSTVVLCSSTLRSILRNFSCSLYTFVYVYMFIWKVGGVLQCVYVHMLKFGCQ